MRVRPFLIAAGVLVGGYAALSFLGAILLNRDLNQVSACEVRLGRLSLALMHYASDHDGNLPAASAWASAIVGTEPSLHQVISEADFKCPQARSAYGYAMPASLGGASLYDLKHPESTVLLVEYETGSMNGVATDPGAIPRGRHGGRVAVVYADGHGGGINYIAAREELADTLKLGHAGNATSR